jgi:hypothetical protein
MSATHADTVLDLVGQIYEAALEPEIWPRVLARLAAQTRSASIMLSRSSPSEKDGGRIVVAGAFDPGFIQS